MIRKNRMSLGIMTVILTSLLAGCADVGSEAEDSKSSESNGDAVKVGLVLSTGGLGDKNFNDMSYAGVVKAQEELGIEFDYVEPSSVSDFVSMDTMFAESGEYDLVIVIGADQNEAVEEVSAEFPEQKISIIDSTVDLEGVRSISTKWAEQTFFSGVLAGLGTQSEMEKANDKNVIGVVLGKELPNLVEGATSFIAGAKYVNPDVEILEATVGAFNDPGKAKEIALSMYNRDADFIQHIAGASGIGVFGAAKEADAYAFGVGANQNSEEPEHIVATSIRNVDEIVYKEIKDFCEGKWEPGVHVSGLKEGAVGYSTESSDVEVPEEILDTIEDIKEKVLNGELTLCDKREDLESWVAENHYEK